MKILTLCGSPRKRGNTSTVLRAFEQLAGAADCAVERVDLATQDIRGCLGCDHCQREAERPGCVQKDDWDRLLQKMLTADVVVYAAPVYVWNFPAQMKAALDRHYCLVKWNDGKDTSLIEGKKMMLLATCGGGAEENADLMRLVFEREMDYLHCQILGEFVVPHCSTPAELGPAKDETASRMLEAIGPLG